MRALLLALALLAGGTPAVAGPVLMISLDGLRPDDVRDARGRGMELPELTALAADGASAEGVVGVLPTLTYPSHTTLVTGVSPAGHGVVNNLTFDPEGRNQGGWYWYAADVRARTLWQAARAAGLGTASVHWPVTVGAQGIDANLPQLWRTGTADDRKLLAALATPGLLAPLEARLGAYADGIDETVEGDANRVRFAAAILAERRPAFTTVYLAGIDHAEHHGGPGSPEALDAIRRTDALVGQLVRAARAAMPGVTVVVVSDHGFRPITTDVNLFRPFIEAGLIVLGPDGKVASWEAMPWLAGGTAAIRLARPDDPALTARVAALLDKVRRDPAYHVARVLGRAEVRREGGAPEAGFFLTLEPGYETGRDPTAPVTAPSTYKGMHGYPPSDPAMRATLIVNGPGVRGGRRLGVVDMRGIAPAIARVLDVALPDAEVGPVF